MSKPIKQQCYVGKCPGCGVVISVVFGVGSLKELGASVAEMIEYGLLVETSSDGEFTCPELPCCPSGAARMGAE